VTVCQERDWHTMETEVGKVDMVAKEARVVVRVEVNEWAW